jgi:thymidine kinase
MFSPGLVVITGPMFSGKSAELIRRLTIAKIAKLETRVFKPAIDTRTGDEIRSREGSFLPAIIVKTAAEILDNTESVRVVGIDEAHFFSEELASIVLKLVRSGKQVIVAGLNLDFQEKPFPSMPELLALADEIVQVYALCTACNERVATRSQRLIPGDEQYVVGDAEYAARCLMCYKVVK